MPLYKATAEGQVEMTPEEEAEFEASRLPPAPTEKDYIAAVDAVLQAGARVKLYDSIITASLRAGYPGPFHDEGVAYATWMDNCWNFAYSVLAQVKSNQIPVPTIEAFIAQLPPCPYS